MMERDNLKCKRVKTMEEEFKKLRVKVERVEELEKQLGYASKEEPY